ncbi:MAG: hypothetical protein VX335_02800 [Pseudomonadota bacterium]|nr:hypothetical protein [Pseudomonadota bacterium]
MFFTKFITALLIFSLSFANESIALRNDSSCNMYLIYSDVSPSITNHDAPKSVLAKNTRVIHANLDNALSKNEMFVDEYIFHCPKGDIDLYIVGYPKQYGWVSSMELNKYLTLKNATNRNVIGDIITSFYELENSVIIVNK